MSPIMFVQICIFIHINVMILVCEIKYYMLFWYPFMFIEVLLVQVYTPEACHTLYALTSYAFHS